MKRSYCPFLPKWLVLAYFITFLLCVAGVQAFAQPSYTRGATQLEDILPSSPEASSRVRYADVPFTHSTGTAQYSVPIYEMQGLQLSIPISLEYCSNGIKMDEIAGVAGLGWTLQAGGCITRDVVYMPDEFTDGSFTYTWPSSSLLTQLLARTSNTATMAFLRKVLWNRIDTNADRYSYNFCGLSGLFIINPEGEVVQLQGDGVVISYATDSTTGEKTFTIVGPDGTLYTFACRETGTRHDQPVENSTIYSGVEVDWSATTAWYLTSITSRDGTETATLTYSDAGTCDRSTQTISRTVSRTYDYDLGGYSESLSSNLHTVASSHECKVLSGISLSGYTASFAYSPVSSHSAHTVSSGQDAANYPRRLTSITVTSPTGRKMVRAVTSTTEQAHDGRIVLTGVNIYRGGTGSSGGTLDDRWTFTYKTASHTVSRYSQDWYGYFNGENGDWLTPRLGETGAGRTNLCPYLFSPGASYNLDLMYGAPSPDDASYMMLTGADHDGARTEWEYEGALSGRTINMSGSTQALDISVGVRVKRISVYDGDSLVRVRSFTYGSPAATTSFIPMQETYMRTSARQVYVSGTGGGLGQNQTIKTAWGFTLHETPVTDGRGLQAARIWYGSVTEAFSPDGTDTGNKVVYTYSTSPVTGSWYNTLSRFPSYWTSEYNSSTAAITPFMGVQTEYCQDGAEEPAQLTQKDIYRRNPDTGASELVQTEKYSYDTYSNTQLLTGYKAVLSMSEVPVGTLYERDMQHYPLYTRRSLGYAPGFVWKYRFRPSGTDTTFLYNFNVSRTDIEKPIRRRAERLMSSDASRGVEYTYPDTWSLDATGSAAPSWAAVLSSAHALSVPVRKDYIVQNANIETGDWGGEPIIVINALPPTPIPTINALADTTTVVTEYATFNGHLMPSATVEYHNGVESWREDILERGSLGNPTRIKAKGEPETTVVWAYKGHHPVAVLQNVPYSAVTPVLIGDINFFVNKTSFGLLEEDMLETLRTGIRSGNVVFPAADTAHVTTMRFIPGVGPTQVTDPAGITTSYTYDFGGRLASVSNTLGQTTDRYSYSLLNPGGDRLHAVHRRYRSPAQSQASSSASVTWWNTLGQTLQQVDLAASGDGQKDLVSAFEGDYMLRDDVRSWLPYPDAAAASESASWRSGAPAASALWHGSASAYSGRTYEQSSRDEVLSESLPGYDAHPDNLSVDVFPGLPMTLWYNDSLRVFGPYGPGQLEAHRRTDADGVVSLEVRDHARRLLASSPSGQTDPDDMTRYIYDEADRLCLVAGAGVPLTDTLSMWRYSYDSLGRLSSKGVPGSVREFYTYDDEDRIIEKQRGDVRTLYTYDGLGRLTYAHMALGTAMTPVMTESHVYDSQTTEGETLLGGSQYTGGPAKGFETFARLICTDPQDNFSGYTVSAHAYDSLGRLSRSAVQYPDGHVNTTDISYDFSGSPVLTTTVGLRSAGDGGQQLADTLSTAVSYDLWERPTCVVTTLVAAGAAQAVTDTTLITYDALGRRSAVTSASAPSSPRGGSPSAGTVSSQTSYTLQGWPSSLSASVGGNGLFSETLSYDTFPAGASVSSWASPSHTGRISRRDEVWTVGTSPSQSQTVTRGEDFLYGAAGRLVRWDDGSAGEDIDYDLRGNMTSMYLRSGGSSTTTGVQCTYSGDRLGSASTAAGTTYSFTHDGCARMTSDGMAGLDVSYNPLDLPQTISGSGTVKVRYRYMADGTKIAATDASGEGLLYRGPFTYRVSTDSSGGTPVLVTALESVPIEGGRLTPSGALYYVRDHLGSVRAVVDGSAAGTPSTPPTNILAMDDFTPYGDRSLSGATQHLTLQGAPAGVTLRHRFTAQEDQWPDFSVPYTDFGARQYNTNLRRWMVPDPMGETYYDISPYVYCAGDPVRYLDPDGNFLYINGYQFFEGQLYDDHRSVIEYERMDEFSKSVVNAINFLNTSQTARDILTFIQNSEFSYNIVESPENKFTPNYVRGAYAYEKGIDVFQDQIIGSGGTVSWNPAGKNVMTTKGERNNPEINLAHELSHADDAGHGRLVDGEEQFVKRNEWQAMYNENLIRGELGLPYRLYYRVAVDPEGNVVQYLYPKFIVKKQPIKPTWY